MAVGALEVVDVLLLDLVLAIPDDIAHFPCFGEHVAQCWNKVRIEEDGLGSRGHHRMSQAFLTQRVIGSDNGHGLRCSGVERSQPVGTGGSKDVYSIALDHAKLPQTGAHVEAQCLIVVEGDVLVGAELEVGPGLVYFLLFAIDHLLDLLGLLVCTDEAPRAHTLGIAILGDTHAHEFIGSGNVIGGFCDQAILGQRMASRLRLTLDFGRAGGFDREGAAHQLFGLQDRVPVLGLLPLVVWHDAAVMG